VQRVAEHCVIQHTLDNPPEVDVEIIHRPPKTAVPGESRKRVAAVRRI
jgi:hypothetical protein